MVEIALANAADVLGMRAGDVVGEGRGTQSKPRLHRRHIVPDDPTRLGGTLRLGKRDS